MDTQGLVMFTAIGVATSAGVALLAIDIRFYSAVISDGDRGNIASHGNDFYTEFMARNARIAEERHFAQIAAKIRSTDPNLMHAYNGIERAWSWRFGDFNLLPF
jgi:hypothetical protein